jgi:hypothetical protein
VPACQFLAPMPFHVSVGFLRVTESDSLSSRPVERLISIDCAGNGTPCDQVLCFLSSRIETMNLLAVATACAEPRS